MATMQLVDIREMGEGLTRARELCQGAQYEQGLALYETTLNRLRQFIRKMNKMSERQPWLQMQIELENELNLLTDHVELIQAFKVPPGLQRKRGGGVAGHDHQQAGQLKNHNYRAPGPVDDSSPGWEIYTPESRKQSEDRDPDVWAPPSPDQISRGGRNNIGGGRVVDGGGGFGGARAPPSWANNDANNRGGNNNRAAKLAPKPNKQTTQPSGRRTPSDDQRKAARPAAKPSGNMPGGKNPNAKNSDKGAPGPGKQLGPSGKQKYADLAKEEGWVDLELIEMIERDIVDNGAKVTFENIAGLDHTKQLLQEAVMLPQIAPHLFKDGLLKPCSGVLMFGPPGTGKTLLAKAVANVCNTTFFNVSASTLASKYRGESEKMVRILFDMARYYSPSIIFMDEIDAIAGARGGSQEHESSRRVKTELLVQMNGVSSGDPADPSNRVMVLAATNLPWELDEAMRRRLTKRVYIPLPGPEGRRQLFKINLEKVDLGPDIDYDMLVAETEGYSGDDICGVCETAKMMPVKRLYTPEVLKELHRKKQEGASEAELKAHEKNALVVTWSDFKTALDNVSKSVGADQLERFVKWEAEFGSK